MRKIILLAMSMVCSVLSFAQNGLIKGRIVDELDNSPVIGANIVVVDSNKGVISDNQGEFTIPCSGSVRLKITHVGYRTLTKTFDCSTSEILEIQLKSNDQELEKVEVTANANSNKLQLEQPVSIVEMDNRALKRGTGLFMDDAINTNVPGVFMQRRTQSGGQQINIRGYGSGMGFRGVSNNFDGQGVKMYLNGIPITDAEGITLMDDIDYGSVSNTSVLKGPSGTLYGLAIAGVINMKTEQAPKNKTIIGQDVMLGNYGLVRSTTRLSIGNENSSILVNYGNQKYDGFMDHTKSTKDFVNLTGDFRLNAKHSVNTYFGYANSYDERNGELTIEQYETLDYSGNARYIKNNAHSAVKTFRAGIGNTYRFSNTVSNTTSLFGSSQSLDNSSAGGWTDKSPLNYGLRSVFDLDFDLSDQVSLSGNIGVEAQKMNAQTVGYGMSADSTNLSGYNIITSIRSNQVTTSSTASYFTQWTLKLPNQLSLTAGLGISNMKISLEDRLWGLSNNHPGNEKLKVYEKSYNSLVSPTLAINKEINSKASVYASYSTGYKAPVSSNILISTTGELNTGLKPEKGTQFEVGTKGNFGDNKLFYTLAIFQTKFQDKFTTVTVQNPDNTATLYSYLVNGGQLNNKGIEGYLNYRAMESSTGFIRLLQPFVNFTYSDFQYEDYQFEKVGKNSEGQDMTVVEDYSGLAVAGVAPFVLNAGVDVETNVGFYGNVYFNYRSSMPYTSDGLNETDPYELLNSKIGYRKSISHFDLDVYVAANNITGTQYYNMVFVNQLPDAYIPTPNEINFFGGLNLKYTF
ncbi:iron complex outermembrane receptor protein [Algoriphagus iocasae]|uniref:Iron complex outermembrane receptor protein n=1 Tax=Algoriphagus iocasae TaxID=1836499 RepID=A0A841N107_9BACT|nr:TonB-dependent receptor [Algoriphagus iocasae]MBB6328365.1 iron complex outermembrane receptor protein [Algoriphagus iocasae]